MSTGHQLPQTFLTFKHIAVRLAAKNFGCRFNSDFRSIGMKPRTMSSQPPLIIVGKATTFVKPKGDAPCALLLDQVERSVSSIGGDIFAKLLHRNEILSSNRSNRRKM
jgi:hypothetical protein